MQFDIFSFFFNYKHLINKSILLLLSLINRNVRLLEIMCILIMIIYNNVQTLWG